MFTWYSYGFPVNVYLSSISIIDYISHIFILYEPYINHIYSLNMIHPTSMCFPVHDFQLWRVLEQQRLSALRLAMRLLKSRSVLVATFGLEAGDGLMVSSRWFDGG